MFDEREDSYVHEVPPGDDTSRRFHVQGEDVPEGDILPLRLRLRQHDPRDEGSLGDGYYCN